MFDLVSLVILILSDIFLLIKYFILKDGQLLRKKPRKKITLRYIKTALGTCSGDSDEEDFHEEPSDK